jgi:hypothetical protein
VELLLVGQAQRRQVDAPASKRTLSRASPCKLLPLLLVVVLLVMATAATAAAGGCAARLEGMALVHPPACRTLLLRMLRVPALCICCCFWTV